MQRTVTKKYTCLVYGEGRRDKNFLMRLIDLEKFKYHTQNWHFNYGNASGGAAEDIVEQCRREIVGYDYDLVLCFIDLDKLKEDYPKDWNEKKIEIEEKFEKVGIKIIWQLNNAEEEYIKVLGNIKVGKHGLNKIAKDQVEKFINSEYWKRILKVITEIELKLKSNH